MIVNNIIKKVFSQLTAMASKISTKFVWIDMEMTGLNVETEEIMEVACVLTNPELEPLHEGYHTIIHVDQSKLQVMNEWCQNQHGKTGLTEACRSSTISLAEAERSLRTYIQQHSTPKDTLYMTGNTIYMDHRFLEKYMPSVHELLHYRLVDVSTIKTVGQCWYPNEMALQPKKKALHRALDDIHESIAELRYYRETIFR